MSNIDLLTITTKQRGSTIASSDFNAVVGKVNELVEAFNDAIGGPSASVENAVVVGINQKYIYTGEPIIPSFRVYLSGKLLEVGTDYDYQVENNIDFGTAIVKIYGVGRYTGLKTVNFTIEGQQYNVTYQSDHATAPQTHKVSVFTSTDLPTLTDDNYAFGGWFDADNHEYKVNDILTKDVTLIAKWTAKTFTLTYSTAHGTVVQPSGKVSAIPVLPVPSEDGWYFDGWYYANGNKAVAGQTITADTTLTAKWVNTGITLNALINTAGETTPETLTITADETVETVALEYSLNGTDWSPYTQAIPLDEQKTVYTRLKYNGTVISESFSIESEVNNDVKSMSFSSDNGTVKYAGTEEAVGTINLLTYSGGEKEITDGVQTAKFNVTSNS